MIDTEEYYGGTYPDPPEEIEYADDDLKEALEYEAYEDNLLIEKLIEEKK